MLRIVAGRVISGPVLRRTPRWPREWCVRKMQKAPLAPSHPSRWPGRPELPTVDLSGPVGSVWLSPAGCCENACFPGRTLAPTWRAAGIVLKSSPAHIPSSEPRLASSVLTRAAGRLPWPSTGKHSGQLQSPEEQKELWLHLRLLVLRSLIVCLSCPAPLPRWPVRLWGEGVPYTERCFGNIQGSSALPFPLHLPQSPGFHAWHLGALGDRSKPTSPGALGVGAGKDLCGWWAAR